MESVKQNNSKFTSAETRQSFMFKCCESESGSYIVLNQVSACYLNTAN
jgi:hypothetical protein